MDREEPRCSREIDVSIVLPIYNEEPNLVPLDSELRSVLRAMHKRAEIIYVDDYSRDGSRAVLEQLLDSARTDPVRTRVVRLRRNYGQTAAMTAGFQLAEGSVIVPLDADGQNSPADIPRLLAELEKGYDVVSGWRKNRKDKALSRKLPSRVANWLIGVVSGVRLHDHGCTMKAYRASLLKELHLYGEMHRFIPLYLNQIGAKVGELVVDHRPRTAGVSKYGPGRIVRVALDVLLIRFITRYYNRPMHFFGQMGLVFFAMVLLILFLMVVFKYGWLRVMGIDYKASFVETPLPALAGTFLVGMIVSLFFGILAEILIRVHYESRGARPYAIESVQDSTETAVQSQSTDQQSNLNSSSSVG
jgi:glycosyltransferase involved in cell wall biosynthesis